MAGPTAGRLAAGVRLEVVISVELAARLRTAGLEWQPAPGDRFAIPDRDLDGQVFVVSEMTVETVELPSGGIVRFNGTTERALDSIAKSQVIWLPHEAQLRALLGPAFLRLELLGGGFVVEAAVHGRGWQRFIDIDAERAYARALLAVLGAEPRS
jgi:hypothetical protein